jgi:hypothetical protein
MLSNLKQRYKKLRYHNAYLSYLSFALFRFVKLSPEKEELCYLNCYELTSQTQVYKLEYFSP